MAASYEWPEADTLRCMSEAHTRPRAGRGATLPGRRTAPLLPHALYIGRARGGDGGARGVDYERPPRRGDGELMAAMESSVSTQTKFTPWRENGWGDNLDAVERRRWETYARHYHLREARGRDRDSARGPAVMLKPTPYFERWGRRFVRMFPLDILAEAAGAPRGTAKGSKPDPEYRQFLKDWQKVQWAREDAAMAEYGDSWEHGGDVPLRAVLGGIQDFTPWRENEDPEDWDDYVRELKKKTHKRPKGYAAWRPQKKTARLIMQVKEVLKEYEDHLPLTNRQIFYRLVAAYGYPKTESFAKNLNDHLTRARRSKKIPFDAIRDDGISIMDHAHYADENAFYKAEHERARAYKRDKLARQGLNIRVYCEAAGMMPQLEKVCEPYSIPVYSCSGFDSVSAKYELNKSCWQAFVYKGRRTVILHLGDHDPSGESIFNDGLVEDIHAFLAEDVPHKDPREVADFERVALVEEHVERYSLETEPPKATDSRTANWKGARTGACQLEALPPDKLAVLLEAAIKRQLDMTVYREDLKAEEEERRRITKALPSAGGAA